METTMTFEQFVENNQNDLEKLYGILKSRIETELSFKDFTKFCYVKTYYLN